MNSNNVNVQFKKKKVLIDLSSLKNIYCGLGQVALNYGNYFKENYNASESIYELTFLMPKKLEGMFGDNVKYISSTNLIRKHFNLLIPRYDIWHSIHQLSRFSPTDASTKQILTIHDLNYLYEKSGEAKDKLHTKIQKKVERANIITCISKFAKKDIESHLNINGKNCLVIYNGVEQYNQIDSVKPKSDIKAPFFFSIGVLERKKNFHVLFDMMKQMPDKTLYIAGKEPKRSKHKEYVNSLRQQLIDKNIHNVVLLGPVSQEEKIWLYKNCEAFIFPSLFEGFGLPIIEALQFGKPVIANKGTSLIEIGDKHVGFIENFDSEHIKQVTLKHINEFSNSPDRIRAAIKYAETFTYKKHFQEYEKLYSQL